MKRCAAIAALALVTFLGCSETPTAPELGQPSFGPGRPFVTPGEQQPVVDLGRGTLAIYPELAGQNLTQTFTPRANQVLAFIRLPVGCVAGVVLNVKLRDGVGGPLVWAGDVVGLPQVVDGVFHDIQVGGTAGIKIRKGRVYAFELASFAGPGAAGTTCGLARGPVGDSYARGRGFYRDPINGPSWLPLPNGLATDQEDLPFVTLVR
jgi:hypothetical protein